MPRTHERDNFYKFASLDAARLIIDSLSLRWSSPLKFNDPFDTQTGFLAGVDEREFATRMVQRLEQLVFDQELPHFFDPRSELHYASSLLRKARERLPRKQILEELHETALEIARDLPRHVRELSETITNHLCHARVLCLTEEVNNVVMWSHYADQHQGVAFKFRCLDDIDHPFLVARKVEYSTDYVSLGNSTELADHFSKANQIDISELSWRLAFSKHTDWSYEREWRCYFPLLNEPEGDGYRIMRQDPRLFDSIYLGCRMSEQNVIDIITLTRECLPNTRIFKATKSSHSFDLVFTEIL